MQFANLRWGGAAARVKCMQALDKLGKQLCTAWNKIILVLRRQSSELSADITTGKSNRLETA